MRCFALAVAKTMLATALTLPVAPIGAFAGTIEQTTEPLLLCSSYDSLKESIAAIRAKDSNWLAQTGCLQVRPSLKVSSIECDKDMHYCEVRVWTNDGRSRTGYTLYQKALD